MMRHIRMSLLKGGWIILAGLTLAGVVLLLRLKAWPFELFQHFVLHYFLLSSVLATGFLLVRKKVAASWSLMLLMLFTNFLWNVYSVTENTPLYVAASTDGSQDRPRSLTVITQNVRDTNKQHQELRAWLRSKPADVVVLQEVPAREVTRYRNEQIYTHQREIFDPALNHPKFQDDRAFVILSKYPISAEPEFKPFKGSRPIVIVRVAVPDAKDPWIVAVDTKDPKTMAGLADRDSLLLGVAQKISELPGPVVVAGDFNATPFTPVFNDFVQRANVSLMHTPVSTFPATFGWLGIPIDHILVRGVRVKDIEALSSIGSDHRPLKATLILPEQIPGVFQAIGRNSAAPVCPPQGEGRLRDQS
jgi:endonuclease/exonuclease/phosphatase (EEP) superfamily protein YafD